MGEWKSIRLKDIANKVREKNSSEEYDVVFSNSALNGIVIQTDFFDKEIANKANLKNYTVVKKNDFVYNPRISRLAPCGPINKNNTQYTGLVSPLYKVFRVDAEKCNLNYIEHYFSSSIWHRYMNSVANYGARSDRMNITDVNFFNLKIELPNPKEQEKIATILSTWDKAIELKEKLIEQKKEQKKGLMQKLLTGEVRLPGFDGAWKKVKLKDIASINKRSLNNKTNDDYEYYYYDLTSVDNGQVTHPAKKIKYKDSPSRARRIFEKSDILMSTVRPNLKGFAYIDFDANDCIASTGFAVISTKRKEESKLVYYHLFSERIETQIKRLLVGSNYPAINIKDVENLQIAYPPTCEERKRVSEIFSIVDNEITLLSKKIFELQLQKKGLMQLLLTGKVRVKV